MRSKGLSPDFWSRYELIAQIQAGLISYTLLTVSAKISIKKRFPFWLTFAVLLF